MFASDVILRASGLTHTFGSGLEEQVIALNDVAFDLARGQLALIMGPSGSGKSTLLAVLSGLLRPDQGEVHVLGKDLWRLSGTARKQLRLEHSGFIFQGFNLFPALTAQEQLEIVLRWGAGVSAQQAAREASEMLDLLGLARKKHLRPAQLSGGEKQRVAIGRALIKNPVLCFADEPTSALDWAHGQQVIELLRTAALARGTAVVVVGHDHRLIPYMDRLCLMDDGRLTEQPCLAGTESRTEV